MYSGIMDATTGERLTKSAESFRAYVYDDATGRMIVPGMTVIGHPTIAWGNRLDQAGAVSLAAGDVMFKEKYAEATTGAMRYAGENWLKIDPVRQLVFIDMAYQMGGKLSAFVHMWDEVTSALETGDWNGVAVQMLDSAWAKEESPRRAARNAAIIRSGVLPQDFIP